MLDAGALLVVMVKFGLLVMVEVVRMTVYFVLTLVGVGWKEENDMSVT